MAAIAEFWRERSAREQALLAALAVLALGAIWYFAAVGQLLDRAETSKQMLAAEDALLERLDRVGSRMAALPAPRARSDASLLLLVNRSVRDAGLGGFGATGGGVGLGAGGGSRLSVSPAAGMMLSASSASSNCLPHWGQCRASTSSSLPQLGHSQVNMASAPAHCIIAPWSGSG